MTPIENLPVKFNDVANNNCDNFDQREYCQMAERTDPLNLIFDLDISGDNIIDCPDFDDTGCCFGDCSPEGTWTAYGQYYYVLPSDLDSTFCMIGDEDDVMLSYDTIPAGTYKLVIVIPDGQEYVDKTGFYYNGTFKVTIGDYESGILSTAPGTITLYPTTTGGDLIFTALELGTNLCLDSVHAYPMCTSYNLIVTNKDGGFVSLNSLVNIEGGQGLVQANWENIVTEDGCYRICIESNCTENSPNLVVNGGFASGASWLVGTGWVIFAGVASHTGTADAVLRQNIVLIDNMTYIITVTASGVSAGGDVNVYIGNNLVGNISNNGTFSFQVNGNYASNDYIEFYGDSNISIDNIILKALNKVCSVCYAVGTFPCSKLLSWTNDDDAFGIPYSSIAFTNYLRVECLLEKPRYPQEVDRFAFSDGRRKILYASSEKIWGLFFDYLPEYLHDALAIGKIHDHFYIDGVEYICSSDEYQPEWRNRLKLAQSKIEVQKVIDNNKNKNC